MTVRLKKLREQPLLNPPASANAPLITVTAKDWREMMESLDAHRKLEEGSSIAERIALMKTIDESRAPVPTDEDWKIMENNAQTQRTLEPTLYLGQKVKMKMLDPQKVKMAEGDLKLARDEIVSLRGRKAWSLLLITQYYARDLLGEGVPTLTQEDWSGINQELTEARERHSGWDIGLLISYMKKSDGGRMPDVTRQDWIDMQATLEECRSKSDGSRIAEILGWMKMIGESDENRTPRAQVPPIKKYVK